MPAFGERLITIVSASIRQGRRCRYCQRAITWATTASTPGHRARTLPFDGRPFPLNHSANNDTGVEFEDWPRGALHFATCPKFPPRPERAPAKRRTGHA